jgi:hypothetical protein
MPDPFREGLAGDSGERPDRWDPKPGDMLVGTLVRYKGPFETQYGQAFVAQVMDESTGKDWSVWLLETVLLSEFQALAPNPGERIGIKYVGLQKRDHGDPYKMFIVRVDRKGEEATNPFRKPAPSAEPAPAPSPPRANTPQAFPVAPSRPELYEPPPSAPPEPSGSAEARFQRLIEKYRVEPWGVVALARQDPRLEDDPKLWGEADYVLASNIVGEFGPTIFNRAAAKRAQEEPADPEFIAELERRAQAEDVPPKLRMRVTEALQTGWHDAVVDAGRLLEDEHPDLPW